MNYKLEDETLIVLMDRDLDHHNAAKIKQEVDEFVYKGQAVNVIFDFRNTSFMDSSGIGVVMGRHRLVGPLGGKVKVRNLNRNVDRIFLISGLYKVIEKDN